MTEREALLKAIELAGGQVKLAKLLTNAGYVARQQLISRWLKEGMPAYWAPRIEQVLNRRITRYDLVPDPYVREKRRERMQGI